jgi:hypothetical protein
MPDVAAQMSSGMTGGVMNRICFTLAVLACLCGAVVGMSIAVPAADIPASLEPWRAWVLHDYTDLDCPVHFDNAQPRRCWWPSRLDLNLSGQGGLFEQMVTVYAPSWVTLPGDGTHWPESVSSDGTALPVVLQNDRPCVRLASGEFRIKGAFVWNALPELIQVPASVGVLSVTVDGRPVEGSDLDLQGRLQLRGKQRDAAGDEAMTIAVFRLIEDDIPMRITTRVLLTVSGRPREIRLDAILPEGGTPMHIDSPLPTRLTPDNGLLVQTKPGRWDLRVTVRMQGPVDVLTMGDGRYGDETWSFKPYHHLRMVDISGAPAIEPSRTRMPDAWQRFAAYQVAPGGSLTLAQTRRGDPDPAPDQLDLDRSWWLDFDGRGYTIHDRITGTLNRTWHLAMQAPVQLGRIAVDGQDQLITRQNDLPGVQLRRGRLSLAADSRIAPATATLPAVGWDHDFEQVRGVLHLPPGWVLFSAGGVDGPTGSWLQRWTLLDLFLTLIIAIGAYKVRNRVIGLLALLTLVLTFHEPGAPRYVWLHLLAAAALLRYLPDNWFKQVVRLWWAAAVVALLVTALPFMVQQVRTAVYPQLAQLDARANMQPAESGLMDVMQMPREATSKSVSKGKQLLSESADVSSADPQAGIRPGRLSTDPDAPIQTGPGLPVWRWRSVPLQWNGPVDRSQLMRLWLMSPTLNLIVGLIQVGLLFLLIIAFLDLRNWRRYLPVTGVAAVLMCVPVLIPAQPVAAQTAGAAFPPPAVLEELRQRLLEPPVCLPRCADVSRLELTATPDQLRMILVVHAQIGAAIPLPTALDTWRPNEIRVDNAPAEQLARDERGTLWMVVPPGVHRVRLTGPTGPGDEIRIGFDMVPHLATYAGVGWRVQGIESGGRMAANIALKRLPSDGAAPSDRSKIELPAFFQVSRTLHLGLQWEVGTRIRRLTAPGQPALLSIPLLTGAAVTTPGVTVEDGHAQVSLGPQEMETGFTATLPMGPMISLTAPQGVPWTETWVLDAASIWQCRISGLTVVQHQDADRNWQPQWRPWPGETVTIAVSRPEAIPGRTVTIDGVRLGLTPGQRISSAELTLDIRASRGGHHRLELPSEINLQSVAIDGSSLPIRQEGSHIQVPLKPGAQAVRLQWHQLTDSLLRIRAPRVDVGDAAVNVDVTFHMPDQRWILLAGGPRLGPAVLFWSYVIVVVLAALVLGRTTFTPLGTVHWLLLGLGLTQVPAALALLVVGWLLALGLRCRRAPANPWAFNGGQLLVAIWTAAALATLYMAIEQGLLGIPDMQIAGNHSTRLQLNWTQDRIDGVLPAPWVLSLPHWVYRLLMLSWALWLAISLLSWLRWGWTCFSRERLWQPIQWRFKARSARRTPPSEALNEK